MNPPEASPESHPCLECGAATHPIIVVETGRGDRHQVLEFTTADSKAGWLMGRFATKGYVGAEMCAQCGRIAFRAVPKPAE